MTDKELQKLKRGELLEIMVEQGREIERLRAENSELQKKLEDRTIAIDRAGSIAEASVQLNGVFEAAHAAAAQYLDNIKSLNERQETVCEQMERETKERCENMEREMTAKYQQMLMEAEKGVDERWKEISQRLDAFYDAHRGLREILAVANTVKLDE